MTQVRLVREVELPPELAAGVSSGRTELCQALNRRLKQKEQAAVVDALAVYIETAIKMQEEINALNGRVVRLRQAVRSIIGVMRKEANTLH